MGFTTEIGWCDCTFNPWIGCARISPGCRFCYAEARDQRWKEGAWGSKGTRRRTSDATWRNPYTWNRKAAATGQPLRVFCPSLADFFEDHPAVAPWRHEMMTRVIPETPWLRWMLLTKRIHLVAEMTAEAWGTDWPSNVWLGTSVEDQRRAEERLPHLLNIDGPAERFASAEPLLEPVVIGGQLNQGRYPLSLLIAGGESGAKARYDRLDDAARGLRDEATAAGVPFDWKQWGEYAPCDQVPADVRAMLAQATDLSVPHTDPHRIGKGRSGRLLDGRTHDGVVRSWAEEMGLELV